MSNPIQVILLKMQPCYGQTSRENATPSSDTTPLSSNKEVHPSSPGSELRFNEILVIQTKTIQKRDLKN